MCARRLPPSSFRVVPAEGTRVSFMKKCPMKRLFVCLFVIDGAGED